MKRAFVPTIIFILIISTLGLTQELQYSPLFINTDVYLDATTNKMLNIRNGDYDDSLTFTFQVFNTAAWLTFDTQQHKLGPLEDVDMQLTINTSSFEPNDIGFSQSTSFRIITNDPLHSTETYDVTILVQHPIDDRFTETFFSEIYYGSPTISQFHYHNYGSLAINYTLSVDDGPQNWLSVNPTSGQILGGQDSQNHNMTINPASLNETTYNGTVTWGASSYPNVTTQITIQVSHPISSNPTELNAAVDHGDQTSVNFTLTNHRDQSISYSFATYDNWLSVDPVSGIITANGQKQHTLNVDATNLAVGTYNTFIRWQSANFPNKDIPVHVTVEGSNHAIYPGSFHVRTVPREMVERTFTIYNYMQSTLHYEFTTTQLSWVNIPVLDLEGDIGPLASKPITMTFNPHDLDYGESANGTMVLTTNDPQDATDDIPWEIEIHGTPPSLILDTSPIEYTLYKGEESQYINRSINNEFDCYGVLSYSSSASVNWLSVIGNGDLNPGDTRYIRVKASAEELLPGHYTGAALVYHNDPSKTSPQEIPVYLTVLFEYRPGDANMWVGAWPPAVLGGDVTYLVNYFGGINPPCNLDGFYCSADINGDCQVLGNDVTAFVNFFRGLGTIQYCPDYPPAWPTPGDIPAEAPPGWPNCE
jgi:hypothetical protein